jgi:hypothetical protein
MVQPIRYLWLAVLLAVGSAVAQPVAPGPRADELALAQALIAERQRLERLKLDPGVSREALLAQERRLIEVRVRLSSALAEELARQSVDADQGQHAWQGMKDFLRDKLRSWLDDEPPPAPGTRRT